MNQPVYPKAAKRTLKPICGCCRMTKPQKNGDARCDACVAAGCYRHYGNWKRPPRPEDPDSPRCGWYIRHKRKKAA